VLLNNVKLINGRQSVNIAIRGEQILTIDSGKTGEEADHVKIHFTDAVAFPGLINSHDHLDFNCFSVLGQRKYRNYTQWGKHIHETYKNDINAILHIPENLRASWGMYKNMLGGVTTVVNHGSFLKIEDPLINIYQESQNLHSVQFEKKWKWKLNNPLLKNISCVIHTGEGTDDLSFQEIDKLLKYNLLNRDLIGVHGVAMNSEQAKNFKGLIWCPESNGVLLGKHADIEKLKAHTAVVFGTDSTLTGNWNIWQHIRFARSLQQVSDAELFNMVTSTPARLWNMNNGELMPGKDADIVIAGNNNKTVVWDDFYRIKPDDILMVLHKGKIRLFDQLMLPDLINQQIDLSRYRPVCIHGVTKYTEGDLPGLMTAIRSYYPHAEFPFDECEGTEKPRRDLVS
jgi:cytosine/adenosine deaminase-related metal-dependent hydrolase